MQPAIAAGEFTLGRQFLGHLPAGRDLIAAVETFCREQEIETAAFRVAGTVTSATVGAYDPIQEVYVTFADASPYEIASCAGGASMKSGVLAARAQIVLCDLQGNTTGGRLFSETIIYSGQIYLQELLSGPVGR